MFWRTTLSPSVCRLSSDISITNFVTLRSSFCEMRLHVL